MAAGTLFLVVGPSGVGKDTLLDGAREALRTDPRFHFVKRTITRPAGSIGEDHEPVTIEAFEQMSAAGEFLAAWDAHGLRYGLPIATLSELENGRHCIANISRGSVAGLIELWPHTIVIQIQAPPEQIAERLAGRGRETAEAIEARRTKKGAELPATADVVTIWNDATPQDGVRKLLETIRQRTSALPTLAVKRMAIDSWHTHIVYLSRTCAAYAAPDYLGPGKIEVKACVPARTRASLRATVHLVDDPALLADDEIGLSQHAFDALGLSEGTRVTIERTPSPASVEALRSKIRGGVLLEAQYDLIVRDIVEGRYPDREVAAFLVSATQSLTADEVLALARVRTRYATCMTWDEPHVVDKHSLGGIPGSRITLVLVPIIAAHGFAMPKTSSRAITSAAGTADAMEILARVDLSSDDVRRVVDKARGCIAWNGRLNHSAVDDVMNAITRPLGIDSTRWSVASILSKKVAIGSTHVVIDLPVGPRAKLSTLAEGQELADLFETVGRGLGLIVEAHVTDGCGPIGRGIGAALEVRDVLWVLDNDPRAPNDLKEKALFFASRLLAFDPSIGNVERGRARAEQLLGSGHAREALDRIVELQGRQATIPTPGRFTKTIKANRGGAISGVDGWRIAGIARAAGAPSDKGAGIDLLTRSGDTVKTGDSLYVIHANSEADLEVATSQALNASGYEYATQ